MVPRHSASNPRHIYVTLPFWLRLPYGWHSPDQHGTQSLYDLDPPFHGFGTQHTSSYTSSWLQPGPSLAPGFPTGVEQAKHQRCHKKQRAQSGQLVLAARSAQRCCVTRPVCIVTIGDTFLFVQEAHDDAGGILGRVRLLWAVNSC